MNGQSESYFKEEELKLKKRDLLLKEKNSAKSWRTTILVPVIIASAAALANAASTWHATNQSRDASNKRLAVERDRIGQLRDNAIKEREQAEAHFVHSGKDALFEREHTLLLSSLRLTGIERKVLHCTYWNSAMFVHEDTNAILLQSVGEDPLCTEFGYKTPNNAIAKPEKLRIDPDQPSLETCLQAGSLITASCRAYDKSGFHSRPRDTCSMSLNAGAARFFAQRRVKVVSQYFRKNIGNRSTADVILPDTENGHVNKFSGQIGCTNSAGTGKTCEAKATVSATSYPTNCLPFLKEIRAEISEF